MSGFTNSVLSHGCLSVFAFQAETCVQEESDNDKKPYAERPA